jgi:hypothetical protein
LAVVVYYLGNSVSAQKQDDSTVIQLLIKGMDGYDAIKERQSKMKQNEAK